MSIENNPIFTGRYAAWHYKVCDTEVAKAILKMKHGECEVFGDIVIERVAGQLTHQPRIQAVRFEDEYAGSIDKLYLVPDSLRCISFAAYMNYKDVPHTQGELLRVPGLMHDDEVTALHNWCIGQAVPGMVTVEIGRYLGLSTVVLDRAMQYGDKRNKNTLYSIDNNPADKKLLHYYIRKHCFNNRWMNQTAVNLRLIDKSSREAYAEYRDVLAGKIDFLFIDADHSYQGVKKDLQQWLPLLRDDAMVVLHDYVQQQGVCQAAYEEIVSTGQFDRFELANNLFKAVKK